MDIYLFSETASFSDYAIPLHSLWVLFGRFWKEEKYNLKSYLKNYCLNYYIESPVWVLLLWFLKFGLDISFSPNKFHGKTYNFRVKILSFPFLERLNEGEAVVYGHKWNLIHFNMSFNLCNGQNISSNPKFLL